MLSQSSSPAPVTAAPTQAPSQSPIVDGARAACLRWFTGKALSNATEAMDMLAASEAQGAWVPKASRRVDACFSKANVIIGLARKHRKAIEQINETAVRYGEGEASPHGLSQQQPREQRGWEAAFLMSSSQWRGRGTIFWAYIMEKAPSDEVRAAIDKGRQFAIDFAPLAQLARVLDATRPLPVFTQLGVSPTLTATLKSIGLDGTMSSIRLCPIRWEKREIKNASGKVSYVLVGIPEWPAGTVHGASRYDNNGQHLQCQACGHGIRQADNWVPLIIDNAAGVPHSLWVGRDCAKSLFGIKTTGAMTLKDRG